MVTHIVFVAIVAVVIADSIFVVVVAGAALEVSAVVAKTVRA